MKRINEMESTHFGAGNTNVYLMLPPVVTNGSGLNLRVDASGVNNFEVVDLKYEDHETAHLWEMVMDEDAPAEEKPVNMVNLSMINDNTSELQGDIKPGMSIVVNDTMLRVTDIDDDQEIELSLAELLVEEGKDVDLLGNHAIVMPLLETIVTVSNPKAKEALRDLTSVSNLSNLVRQLNIIKDEQLLSPLMFKRLTAILTRILNEYVAGSLATGIRLKDIMSDSGKLLEHLELNEPLSYYKLEEDFIQDLRVNRIKTLVDEDNEDVVTLTYPTTLVRLPVGAANLGYRISNELGWGSVYKHTTPSLHRLIKEVTGDGFKSMTILTTDGYMARVVPIVDNSLYVHGDSKPYALLPRKK